MSALRELYQEGILDHGKTPRNFGKPEHVTCASNGHNPLCGDTVTIYLCLKDGIFEEAGFEWRLPGCSMCLGMNDDKLVSGDRCASTSNRNFEGRQGRGARTHLVSPAMAAAAAITGRFADVRDFQE